GRINWLARRLAEKLKDILESLYGFECGSRSCLRRAPGACQSPAQDQTRSNPCEALRDTAALARFTYLRLLDFRDGYYARSRLLDQVNNDGFDGRLFHPPHHFRRGFLHCHAFGLGPGNRSLRRFSSRSFGYLACLTAGS